VAACGVLRPFPTRASTLGPDAADGLQGPRSRRGSDAQK